MYLENKQPVFLPIINQLLRSKVIDRLDDLAHDRFSPLAGVFQDHFGF